MPSEIGSPVIAGRLRPADVEGGAGAGDGAGHDLLGDHHRRRLQNLDVLLGIDAQGAVLDDEHAIDSAATDDRHRQQRVIHLLAGFRPVGERRMVLRIGLVDRNGKLGAAADQALAALHAGIVHRVRIEPLGGEQLERAVLALEIDRAHLGDHQA